MFTKTKIDIPNGSVTFYQREGTMPSVEMKKVMTAHELLSLPSKEGGICHASL
jgi:hypothetical protein